MRPRPTLQGAWWPRPLIGLLLLAGVVWWAPLDALADAFEAIDVGVALSALGIGLATTVLCAARWWTVARGTGLCLPWSRAVGDYYRAVFLNAVLPSGVLGDVHRAIDHGRYAGDVPRGVRAVVLERMAGQVVLAAAGAVALFVLPAASTGPGVITVAVWAGVAGLLAMVAVCAPRFGRRSDALWWRVLRETARDVRNGLCTRTTGPAVLVLSVAALAGHVTLFVVAARAAGVTEPVGVLLPPAVAALIAMSVPAGVGGWGPREAVTALVFGAVGLGASVGLTVSVVYGLLALVAALPGGVVFLWRLLRVEDRQVGGEPLDQGREQVPPLDGRGA